MGLADRAAALAAEKTDFGTATLADETPTAREYEPNPELDIDDPDPDGYPQIPVYLAWLRVRKDIKSIGKNRDYKESQQGPVKYKFRGVDDALEAFAPITLLHGVNIIPFRTEASFRDARTSTGKPTRECTVTVTWHIVGPMGDKFECQSVGESLDSGDKGSSKAQSVALRVLLFGTGLIPPKDPTVDMSTIERGEAPVRDAESYVAEIFNPATTFARYQQILSELTSARMRHVQVHNENNETETLGDLCLRIGKDRNASGGHFGHAPGSFNDRCPVCKAEQSEQTAVDRELAGASA